MESMGDLFVRLDVGVAGREREGFKLRGGVAPRPTALDSDGDARGGGWPGVIPTATEARAVSWSGRFVVVVVSSVPRPCGATCARWGRHRIAV